MYLDIEKQLNKITDGLKQELLSAKAIDESGRTIDEKKFNEILDKKIAQCSEVLATTEKDGVTKDLYGANIAYARIGRLETIKKSGMIVPEALQEAKEEPAIEKLLSEKKKKTNAFNLGISKLITKLQEKFKTSRTSENNR